MTLCHPLPLLLLLLPADFAAAQLYADVETTRGNFTLELFYKDVPRTVANFVGLAEGTQPWWDFPAGKLRVGQPFYDGIIFHRVIDNFMVQTGSRNGLGTDGPGYKFPDELVKDASGELLYRHLGPGMVSMANSGVHTNGSQFFITVSTQAHLDNKHTVFGKVAAGPGGTPTWEEGMAVINAIANAETDSRDKPLQAISINKISIRRVGADAEAFDPRSWELPQVTGPVNAGLDRQPRTPPAPSDLILDWRALTYRAYHVTYSFDLRDWVRFETTSIFDTARDYTHTAVTSSSPALFFQVVEVDYSALIEERLFDLSDTAVIKLRIGTTNPLEITVTRSPDGGTWRTGDGATGTLLVMTDGAGPGDAGLFSPQATIAFNSPPPFKNDNFPGLLRLSPNFNYKVHSNTEGYFTAEAHTFETPSRTLSTSGTFTIISP